MQTVELTNEGLEFEVRANALKDRVLKHVYYIHESEGFINTRALGEKEFEYAPLSKVFFEMTDGSFFEFFDSSSFLGYYGYYTLDLSQHQRDMVVKEASQDSHFQWSQFLGQKIENIVIRWKSIKYRSYKDDPPDIYPQCMILQFGNKQELVIVASEID